MYKFIYDRIKSNKFIAAAYQANIYPQDGIMRGIDPNMCDRFKETGTDSDKGDNHLSSLVYSLFALLSLNYKVNPYKYYSSY